MNGDAWTEERVAQFRKAFAEGKPFSIIATELGGITRNAAIGKAHRMGLRRVENPSRPPPRRTHATRRPSRITLSRPPRRPPVEDIEDEAPDTSAHAVTMMQLGAEHCRWVLGPPAALATLYCGAPVDTRAPYCSPYCARHARIAYTRIPEQRRPTYRRGNVRYGYAEAR